MGYEPPIEENNELNEPDAANGKQSESLLPWQERIRNAVEMTLKEYGVTREEITARSKNPKITFHKGWWE